MATYSVYARPDDRNGADAIFVSDGFSFAGFIFTGFWALWHRMWIVAVLLFAAMLVASALPLASIAISLLTGVFGNDLKRWSLARRGFSEIGISHGHDLEEAELRFYLSPRDVAAPVVASTAPMSHDTLGLFGVKA